MKPKASCLIEKRDGRVERLRATKVARSIYLALQATGGCEREQTAELVCVVLARLRTLAATRVQPARSADVAAIVESVLVAAELGEAAARYSGVQRERGRRRALWAQVAPAATGAPPRYDRVDPVRPDSRER